MCIRDSYVNYYLGFNISPLTNYLVERSGKIASFDPTDAKPVKYCKKITQPIRIVHGEEDRRINISYGKTNFEELSSRDKEFIEIKGANHVSVWEVGGKKYFEKIFDFIEENSTN